MLELKQHSLKFLTIMSFDYEIITTCRHSINVLVQRIYLTEVSIQKGGE